MAFLGIKSKEERCHNEFSNKILSTSVEELAAHLTKKYSHELMIKAFEDYLSLKDILKHFPAWHKKALEVEAFLKGQK